MNIAHNCYSRITASQIQPIEISNDLFQLDVRATRGRKFVARFQDSFERRTAKIIRQHFKKLHSDLRLSRCDEIVDHLKRLLAKECVAREVGFHGQFHFGKSCADLCHFTLVMVADRCKIAFFGGNELSQFLGGRRKSDMRRDVIEGGGNNSCTKRFGASSASFRQQSIMLVLRVAHCSTFSFISSTWFASAQASASAITSFVSGVPFR